jgi:hypothetical protein
MEVVIVGGSKASRVNMALILAAKGVAVCEPPRGKQIVIHPGPDLSELKMEATRPEPWQSKRGKGKRKNRHERWR